MNNDINFIWALKARQFVYLRYNHSYKLQERRTNQIMGKFFETHRKEIITGAGALLFIIAGALAMILMPPGESHQQKQIQTANQNQESNQESNHKTNQEASRKSNQEPQIQIQAQEQISQRDIYVYLTGAVKKPGVYKFPEGSRIFEVINAAGGFTPKADIAALNLAETFTDAQHIHIPLKGERNRIVQTQNNNTNADTYTHITVQPQEAKSKSNAKSSGNNGLVDVNNASESELQRLTGVGPAIAKRIYEYRQKNGRFKSAEELIHVRGIGPAKLEKMRSQILIR